MAKSPFEQIQAYLANLTGRQMIGLALSVALTAGAVWGITALANRVSYEVIYTGLDPADANQIIERLDEEKVPYKLAAGGGTILVPREKAAELKLRLAGDNLPRGGGSGFELFDQSSFDVSDFGQNVKYQRALERELGRTIEALDSVEKARVHLALPSTSLFADESKTAKASVVLKLRGSRSLKPEDALAIAHLVSSGVRGLEPEKVSIVDTEGVMLRDGQGDDSVGSLTGHQLALKTEFEKEMQNKLVALLNPIVGDGRVRTRVDATLDFRAVTRKEELYDGENAVVSREQKGSQRRTNGSGGGTPGTASNLATGTPVASEGREDTEESNDSTVEYVIPRTTSTIIEPVGDLKKLSVAVVVDNVTRRVPAEDGTVATESVERTPEEMAKISELVRAAIGYDETRGDVLSVTNLPFDIGPGEEEIGELEQADRREFWLMIAKYPSMLLGALLGWFLIVRPVLRSLRRMLAPAPAAGQVGAPGATTLISTGGEMNPVMALRRQLIEISSRQPDGAAQIVRGWLKEKS